MHRVRRAGFKILEFGLESFSDEILSSPFINKHMRADINVQVVEDTLEAGIIPYIFYIAGLRLRLTGYYPISLGRSSLIIRSRLYSILHINKFPLYLNFNLHYTLLKTEDTGTVST